MEDQRQVPAKSNEVDLTEFFRWVGRGFSRTGSLLIAGLAALRRELVQNRLFFVGIVLIGLIVGGMYSELVKRDFYRSSMILTCDYLNTQTLKNTVSKLNLLAGEPGRAGLQTELNLDEATARQILRFDFQPFVSEDDVVEMEVLREQLNNVTEEKRELVEKVIDRLQIENKNAYEIIVYVYDPGIVKALEQAVVQYFRSNAYIDARIKTNRKLLEQRKQKLQAELQKLDSLKRAIVLSMEQRSPSPNSVIVSRDEAVITSVDVFETDLALYKELVDVERRLELSPDFEIVDGFTAFHVPDSAGLADILVTAMLISLLVGYLILGLYRFDRMLANYPSKRSAFKS